MSFNEKKSRSIKVEDGEYRWTCSFGSGITNITIQAADGNGQKCIVQIDSMNRDKALATENGFPRVTPSMVRELIKTARANSWNPYAQSAEIRFHLRADNHLHAVNKKG